MKYNKLLLVFTMLGYMLHAQNPMIQFEGNLTEPKSFLELPDFKNINIRDMAISPNYDEIFFTLDAPKYAFRVILTSKKINNGWSAFEVASFSGNYHDIEPAFSPNGKKLYFASKRPVQEGDGPKADYDIWMVEKENGEWTKTKRLSETINTNDNEYYPSVTNDGAIYFTSERQGSKGKEDIFVSRYVNGEYQKPQSISENINTAGYEYNAFVSADESFIIFCNYGRKDSFGKGDMYISFKNNGDWQQAVGLGEAVNSSELDYCPFVTSDGNYFFFTSERTSIAPHYENLNLQKLKDTLNQPQNGVSRVYYIPFSEVLKKVKNE